LRFEFYANEAAVGPDYAAISLNAVFQQNKGEGWRQVDCPGLDADACSAIGHVVYHAGYGLALPIKDYFRGSMHPTSGTLPTFV
jgi:hypothetical protein